MKRIFGILFAMLLVVSLGLVTVAPVLAGTNIHVPGDYPTIQKAVDAAASGDTIMVAAGEYDAFLVQGKANISIIGTEGATVTTANLIKALPVVGDAWVMAAVYYSVSINIEGISFDGAGVSGENVVGIAYVDSTGRIADLTVEKVIATELGAGVAIIGHTGTSTVEMTGATTSNNDDTGIYVCGGSTLEAHFNNIIGNSQCGLLNDGGEMVDATYNWWGHKSGPLHQTNPLGGGNAVVGDVDFKPWLETQVVTETVTNKTVDAIEQADTEVVVHGTATLTIAGYASNPHPSSSVYGALASLNLVALVNEFEELDIFSDVYVTNTTPGTWLEIRLYYTDNQASGFNETSLRPFWWNGTNWTACSNAGVNTTDTTIDDHDYSGYMWAEIRETATTPTLSQLTGTPWGGYGHPSEPPRPPCFVAAAAFGTDTARRIDILREFRDTVLLPNRLGGEFVSFYYRTSLPIANLIYQHEVLRTAARMGFVDPIVKILTWIHCLWSAGGSLA